MDKTRRLLLTLTATAIAAVESVTIISAQDSELREIVFAILEKSSSPLSRKQIGDRQELEGANPGSVDSVLSELIYQGRVRRRGDGTASSPYLYEQSVTGHA